MSKDEHSQQIKKLKEEMQRDLKLRQESERQFKEELRRQRLRIFGAILPAQSDDPQQSLKLEEELQTEWEKFERLLENARSGHLQQAAYHNLFHEFEQNLKKQLDASNQMSESEEALQEEWGKLKKLLEDIQANHLAQYDSLQEREHRQTGLRMNPRISDSENLLESLANDKSTYYDGNLKLPTQLPWLKAIKLYLKRLFVLVRRVLANIALLCLFIYLSQRYVGSSQAEATVGIYIISFVFVMLISYTIGFISGAQQIPKQDY